MDSGAVDASSSFSSSSIIGFRGGDAGVRDVVVKDAPLCWMALLELMLCFAGKLRTRGKPSLEDKSLLAARVSSSVKLFDFMLISLTSHSKQSPNPTDSTSGVFRGTLNGRFRNMTATEGNE